MANNQNNDERKALVLGALLHDIGKFWQRADSAKESLSAQTMGMESSICKVFDGKYSYKHVLWTSEFFERYGKSFPIDVCSSVSDNALDNCANFASYHHAPSTVLQELIQQADWLSSGVDRRKAKDAEDEYAGSQNYKRIRLDSIFDKIDIKDGGRRQNREWKHTLNPLDVQKDSIFPRTRANLTPPDGGLLQDAYRALWHAFVDEFQSLSYKDSYDLYLANLLYLLEKYTWCIPSSTMDIPDISLFDHSRSVAAIAACLHVFHSETGTMTSDSVQDRTSKKFLLVGGDLSGIQKYLFNLTHTNVKGVSKILRARSFYLSMLPVVATHIILRRLGLPLLCNFMESGGKFIILAPNVSSTITILEQCREQFNEWCMREFFGELVLNLNWRTDLSAEDFSPQGFAKALGRLSDNTEAEKYTKIQTALLESNRWDPEKFKISEHYDLYAQNGVCRCCGKLPASRSYPHREDFSDEEFGRLCEKCYEQFLLGTWLTQFPVVGFSEKEQQAKNRIQIFDHHVHFMKSPPEDGASYYLVEKLCSQRDNTERTDGVVRERLLANYVPQFETQSEYIALCPMCKSRNQCNISDEQEIGQIKTFECLATASRTLTKDGDSIGKPMLGILKADVDRLGYIFSLGLEGMLTLSRYGTMSRMLNMFFTGYLNELLSTEYRNIYTVYSGGDDMLLIGEWRSLIAFSARLYQDFKKYTCENESITLSAGIALVRSKFPINRAAEMADEFLEESKQQGRDRLTLFNGTIEWKEFEVIMQYAGFLDDQLNDDDSKIKSGFLYRLFRYHRMFKDAKRGRVDQFKFHSLMAYDVRRNIRREKNGVLLNEDELNQLYRLFDLNQLDKSLMNNLQIPLSYVLYKNRR
jgi:CRISPR-associated protein Csm1